MGKSKDLATGSSTLYQTQATSDTRYANVAGDTFTGNVAHTGTLTTNNDIIANKHVRLYRTNDQASQWYFYNHTDDTLRFNYNGAGSDEIILDSTGHMKTPYQPYFMGHDFAGRVGGDKASFTNIQQNGSNWNNSTGYFTCPIAGQYLVIASSGYKAADAYMGWGIKYNNSVDLYGWSSYLSNHQHATQCISYIKTANANDTFAAFIANHSSYTTPYVGNNYCAFSVYLLG